MNSGVTELYKKKFIIPIAIFFITAISMGNVQVNSQDNVSFNVRINGGARGDGISDDTDSIQKVLDMAEANGGGIVLLPPGRYRITKPLRLPKKVCIRGTSGTSFKYVDNPELTYFLQEVSSVIILDNDIPGQGMIEPKDPEDFGGSGIENVVLFGNFKKGMGIKIPDVNKGTRSHTTFKNVIIHSVGGTGFYGGRNQHELFFDGLISFACGENGIIINGEDIVANRLWAGNNDSTGIIISSGPGRFTNTESWGNSIGMELAGALDITFFGLQMNRNKTYGLILRPHDRLGYNTGRISIYAGMFRQNSHSAGGKYSDVLLKPQSSGVGPYNVKFFGCQFYGASHTRGSKAKYPIEDISPQSRECVLIGCFFDTGEYQSRRISNRPQIIRASFDYYNTDYIGEVPKIRYKWIPADVNYYNVDPERDEFINVGGSCIVQLPKLKDTQVGRLFYISASSKNGVIKIRSANNEKINNQDYLQISNYLGCYMIINGGTAWVGIKLQ